MVGEERAALAALGPEVAAVAAAPRPTAQPNGAIGLSVRGETIKTLLRFFAKSDFKHDFGEKVPARDWITWEDIKRFTEMVQKLPVSQRTQMINKFTAMFPKPKGKEDAKGGNLLALLQPEIAKQLYPDPPGGLEEFITEEKILEKIGLKYEELKGKIKTHYKPSAGPPAGPFEDNDIKVGASGVFSRNYRVGAQRYKNADGSTRNLASLFRDAAAVPPPPGTPDSRPTKFALLIDASLGMSVTSAGDSSLTPDPGAPCEFIILQNVESDADSATGATDFKIKAGSSRPSTVKVMRDFGTSTVLYPIWQAPGAKTTEAENLFSKIQVILNRVEAGDIEASILLETGGIRETHNIPDVGTTSNVKNASLNGLAALFAREILKDAATDGDKRKPYIYALLKRMGDWCQALSLLDRIRTYKEMDPKTKKEKAGGKTATLQGLIAEGFEIGLVTCDRILLAYGLVLGLNVYFTSASDLNCLIYFKNKDDIANETVIEANATRNYENFKKLIYSLGLPAPGEGIDDEGEADRRAAREALAAAETTARNAAPLAVKAYISTKIVEALNIYSAVIPSLAAPRPAILATLDATIGTNLFPPDSRVAAPDAAILTPIARAFAVKVILSNLGELRTNFADIQSQMKSSVDVYNSVGTPKTKYDATVSLVNLVTRLDMDMTHNRAIINQLTSGVFSGNMFTAQRNVFADLAKKIGDGYRMSTSEIMKRAKDVLLSCQDDIKQVLQKGITGAQILTYLPPLPAEVPAPARPTSKDIDNLKTLYGAFDALRAEIQVPQRGGGQHGGANQALLKALKQREVFPYKSAKLETTVDKLTNTVKPFVEARALADEAAAAAEAEGSEVSATSPLETAAAALKTPEVEKALHDLELLDSLPAVRVGDYYRDEKSRPYSVIDRYLITKEDSKVLETLFKNIVDGEKEKEDAAWAAVGAEAAPPLAAADVAVAAVGAEAVPPPLEEDEDLALAAPSSVAAPSSAAAPADGSEVRKRKKVEGLDEGVNQAEPELASALQSVQDRYFIIYRFALLYHDLLYERYERAYDQWNTEGTFSDDVEIEDSEMTEGTQLEFANIGREAAVLRLFINRLVGIGGGRENALETILQSFQTGVDEEMVDRIRETVITTTERAIFKTFRDAIPNTLARTREVIFKYYKPQMIAKVTDPSPTSTPVDAKDIETLIETGEGPTPVPVDSGLMVEGEEEEAVPALTGDGAGMAEGGSRLQRKGTVTSNAGGTRNDSSRRGLYEGLRKRGGAGGAPEL
jgi:hypothetical protein